MKSHHMPYVLITMITLMAAASGCQPGSGSPEGILQNVDARQALAIANDWKWTNKEIQSYVTHREVVFKLPNDRVKQIPLPDDRMMVAVAPYLNQTHQ